VIRLDRSYVKVAAVVDVDVVVAGVGVVDRLVVRELDVLHERLAYRAPSGPVIAVPRAFASVVA